MANLPKENRDQAKALGEAMARNNRVLSEEMSFIDSVAHFSGCGRFKDSFFKQVSKSYHDYKLS